MGPMLADYKQARGAIPWDGDPLTGHTVEARLERAEAQLVERTAELAKMREAFLPCLGMLEMFKEDMEKAEKVDRRTYEVTCELLARGERIISVPPAVPSAGNDKAKPAHDNPTN